MSAYRPGQLYTGRDGDLLFCVLAEGDIEFVTNRGTSLTLGEVERVYEPLTLVRDVDAPAPDTTAAPAALQGLAAAIRDALDLPIPATSEGWQKRARILSERSSYLIGALRDLAAGGYVGTAATIASVGNVHRYYPVTYPPLDEQDGAGR